MIIEKQNRNKQTPNGVTLFKYKPPYNVTPFGVCFIFLVISNWVGSDRSRCPPTPPGIRLSYQGGFY